MAVALGALFTSPALTQLTSSIQSEQALASQIASRISTLDSQIQIDAENYDQAQVQLQQTQAQIASTRAALGKEQRLAKILHREVVGEAIRLFTEGGDSSSLVTLVQNNVNQVPLVQEYINTAASQQATALVSYEHLQLRLDAQQQKLKSEMATQQQTVSNLQSAQKAAQQAQQNLTSQLAQVKGQLAKLVAQAQAAQQAAEEAKAQAALEAEAAQQAAKKQAETPAIVPAATVPTSIAVPAATPSPVPSQTDSNTQTTTSAPTDPSSLSPLTPSGATPTQAAPVGGSYLEQAAQIAISIANQGDTNYVWGAAGQWETASSGLCLAGQSQCQVFDCSGLVLYVYQKLGIDFVHYALSQYQESTPISYSELQPGDLVFYETEGSTIIDHVAIYIGGGQVVEATNPGRPVSIDPITWSGTPVAFGQPPAPGN